VATAFEVKYDPDNISSMAFWQRPEDEQDIVFERLRETEPVSSAVDLPRRVGLRWRRRNGRGRLAGGCPGCFGRRAAAVAVRFRLRALGQSRVGSAAITDALYGTRQGGGVGH
jgi:hypothetical protein